MQRPLAAGAQRQRIAIEEHLVGGFDLIGKALLDFALGDRRRQQDAALRCRSRQFRDRDVGHARQCRGLLHHGAAAVGEHKTAIATIARDAIGESKREHDPG